MDIPAPKSVTDLVLDFRKKNFYYQIKGKKVEFKGVGNLDVYNPSKPFQTYIGSHQVQVIAGRVEKREDEIASRTMFFRRDGDNFVLIDNAPVFQLQDPFVTKIGKELILLGVEILSREDNGSIQFQTVFYRGKDIYSLGKFARGPQQMKDIRLVALKGGGIGIFTRPQGKVGGKGTVGYIKVDNLNQISPWVLDQAILLDGQFEKDAWGSVNDPHLMSDGMILCFGHIATYSNDLFTGEKLRNYYPTVFKFDPKRFRFSDMRIISERANFPPGPMKKRDLGNVIFTGGAIQLPNGNYELYVGLSDTEVGEIIIPKTFIDVGQKKSRVRFSLLGSLGTSPV